MRLPAKRLTEFSKATDLISASKNIEELLVSLLDNAVKFTPEGGAIRITVDSHEDLIEVSIADSGGGIPSDEDGPVRAEAPEARRDREFAKDRAIGDAHDPP